MIIVNADDYGRSRPETDAALSLYKRGSISSVSAMVFMADSVRASELAREAKVDVGLHINLSQRFAGEIRDARLQPYHESIVRFLTRSKYALLLYHPALRNQFNYVYESQLNEFCQLYGKYPSHVDGHQHFHLCSNMLLDNIIAKGQIVRRSFSFQNFEKNFINRSYRKLVDYRVRRRYRTTDYFFALSQQNTQERMARVLRLAQEQNVELMTHPAVPEQNALLQNEDFLKPMKATPRGDFSSL